MRKIKSHWKAAAILILAGLSVGVMWEEGLDFLGVSSLEDPDEFEQLNREGANRHLRQVGGYDGKTIYQ